MSEPEGQVVERMTVELRTGGKAPERKEYKVVTELFKNGQVRPAGSIVELDEQTAANFLANGDIKEVA